MSVLTSTETNEFRYTLPGVTTRPGLERVRTVVLWAMDMEPIDGSVVRSELGGSPHATITFPEAIPPEVLDCAEAVGALAIPRGTEFQPR